MTERKVGNEIERVVEMNVGKEVGTEVGSEMDRVVEMNVEKKVEREVGSLLGMEIVSKVWMDDLSLGGSEMEMLVVREMRRCGDEESSGEGGDEGD